jgi:DNA-binding SARP family transcriptional activator
MATERALEFRILGPLQIAAVSRAVEPASGKQKLLLACLLIARGDVVSRDRLIDVLWGERAPAAAVNALQKYTCKHCAGGCHQGGSNGRGYRLRVESGELDAEQFELLVAWRWGAMAIWWASSKRWSQSTRAVSGSAVS